jgi:hypothetical protein
MSEPQTGPEEISKLARAARISRLIWVDDKFGQRDLRRFARAIRTKIEVFWRLAPQTMLPHPKLSDIPFGSDPDSIEGRVLSILQGMQGREASPHELVDVLDQQIARLDNTYPSSIKDLSAKQFEEIEAAFRAADIPVEVLSLNEWVDRREDVCANLTDDDLFFIDQDFSTEEGGGSQTGEEILSYLLERPQQNFVCIFFTHALGVADVSKSRAEIADRIGMANKKYRFAVVSKESLTATNGGGYGALRIAFKEAFLKDWCFSIASRSQAAIIEAIAEASTTLLKLDIDELAAAFFRRAFKDGTLEPDVLLRVFFLAARIRLQDERTQDQTLWKRLSNIRRLLAETADDRLQSPTSEPLRKWREREMFDPADVVNQAFSPIFLGDIFAVERAAKKEYFVLVAQPCDLIIRDTGSRNNNEALLLTVSEKVPKNATFAYNFEFPGLGRRWILYSGATPINLNLLDIISFRSDGKLLFTGDVQASEIMLPGLQKKFEKLASSFGGLFDKSGKRTGTVLSSKYRRLSVSPFCGGDEPLKDARIELPIIRVGRIRSPYAEAVLSGFAIHHTREAFDYDFSDLSSFVDKPAQTAPSDAHASPATQ